MAKVTPPTIPSSYDPKGVFRGVIDWMARELRLRPIGTEAREEILLASPDKSVYSIKVTDAGALTITKVAADA